MDRRKFFGFLAAAPVAIPAVVVAAKPAYASGGFASSPQIATVGECGTEAYVPVPNGRIAVNITINGSVDPLEVRRTGYQQAQQMVRLLR